MPGLPPDGPRRSELMPSGCRRHKDSSGRFHVVDGPGGTRAMLYISPLFSSLMGMSSCFQRSVWKTFM